MWCQMPIEISSKTAFTHRSQDIYMELLSIIKDSGIFMTDMLIVILTVPLFDTNVTSKLDRVQNFLFLHLNLQKYNQYDLPYTFYDKIWCEVYTCPDADILSHMIFACHICRLNARMHPQKLYITCLTFHILRLWSSLFILFIFQTHMKQV